MTLSEPINKKFKIGDVCVTNRRMSEDEGKGIHLYFIIRVETQETMGGESIVSYTFRRFDGLEDFTASSNDYYTYNQAISQDDPMTLSEEDAVNLQFEYEMIKNYLNLVLNGAVRPRIR